MYGYIKALEKKYGHSAMEIDIYIHDCVDF